jgi:hypothetical protein
VYKIDEYIPDMFYEQFDTVRETLVDWMVKLGIISGKAKIRSSSDAPCKCLSLHVMLERLKPHDYPYGR